MTDERFNVYQLEVIKRCFDIVKEEVDSKYRSKTDEMLDKLPRHGRPRHWDVMKESVDNFDTVSGLLLSNKLDRFSGVQWQEMMLLVEVVEHGQRNDPEKTRILDMGLNLLVGMFRNQFPGEKWNPEDYRWTTVGDTGLRGISPMLMAIAEL